MDANFCQQGLVDFAKVIFQQQLQRHTYVRCPDIAKIFHKNVKQDYKVDEKKIRKIQNAIRDAETPIVSFGTGFSASLVAQALYRENANVNKLANILNESEELSYRVKPNSLLRSFVFIRAVPHERNERFWHTIWHIVGGDYSLYEKFCTLVSLKEPAKILARILNRTVPTKHSPTRAPDILIIIGAKHLSTTGNLCPHGPFARLSIDSLSPVLAKFLRASKQREITKHIGRCRVILVEDDSLPDLTHHSYAEIVDAPTHNFQQRLSVFRYGFTYRMVGKMLDLDDADCQILLDDWIRQGYIYYAEKAGEYFLCRRVPLPSNPRNLAQLHLDAANAYLGFLFVEEGNEQQARFLDCRQSFHPASTHEAQQHLTEALRATYQLDLKVSENRRFRSNIHLYRARAAMLSEVFGWSRIWWAGEYTRQNDPELLEILETHLSRFPPERCHPIELICSARFMRMLARSIKNDPRQKDQYEEFESRVARLIEAAYQVCRGEEQDACRYLVATASACFVLEEEPSWKGVEKAKKHIDRAKQFAPAAREILYPDWFEFLGDMEKSHRKAVDGYIRGIVNWNVTNTAERIRSNNVVKYIGTCCLLTNWKIHPKVIEYVENLPEHKFEYLTKKSFVDSGLHELWHVRKRWNLGIQWLSKQKLTG